MKLHSPRVEKKLRQQVRAEIRRSRELKKEAKRQRRRRQFKSGPAIVVGATSIFLAIGVSGVAALNDFSSQLAYCTLASLVLVTLMTVLAFSILTSADALIVFYHLPISDKNIFRRQWGLFVRRSSGLIFVFLVLFGTLGFSNGFGAAEWMAIVFLAVIQWVVMLVSIALLVAYCRYRWVPAAGLAGVVTMIFMMAAPARAASLYRLLSIIAKTPYWLLPTGWTSLMLEQFRGKNYLIVAGGLGLVGLYCLALRPAVRKILASSTLPEPSFAHFQAEALGQSSDTQQAISPAPVVRVGPTELEDRIRERLFLKPLAPARLPWLDTFVSRRLTRREAMLVEFIGNKTLWAAQWKRVAISVAIFVLYARFVSFAFVPHPILFIFLSLIFIGAGMPLTNPIARGFIPSFFSGTNIRWYSGFPLSFQELSRLIIKLNCLRLLAFAPLLLVYGIGTAMLYGFEWQKGLVFGVKIIALLVAFQPTVAISFFSAGTNDTSRGGFKVNMGAFLGLSMILAFLGLAAATIFVENQMVANVCLLVAAGISILFYLGYRWLFNRSRFDLIQIPQKR